MGLNGCIFQYISEIVFKICLAGQIRFGEKKGRWLDFYMVNWSLTLDISQIILCLVIVFGTVLLACYWLLTWFCFSVAGFQLVLARKVSFYIITFYLPSGLFVVISWISFLVNPECIPGRMSLLITIFLVLINIFNTIQTNSPQVKYWGRNLVHPFRSYLDFHNCRPRLSPPWKLGW